MRPVLPNDMAPKLVDQARQRQVTPHVTQNTTGRRIAIDARTTRHVYASSQCIRARIKEIFGWMKTVGGFRRTRYRRLERSCVGWLAGADRVQPGTDGPLDVAASRA